MKQSILNLLHALILVAYETIMTGFIFLSIQQQFITPVWHVTIFPSFRTAMYTGILLVVSIAWLFAPHIHKQNTPEAKHKEYITRWVVPVFSLLLIHLLCWVFVSTL